jgi:hypothetical protein
MSTRMGLVVALTAGALLSLYVEQISSRRSSTPFCCWPLTGTTAGSCAHGWGQARHEPDRVRQFQY